MLSKSSLECFPLARAIEFEGTFWALFLAKPARFGRTPASQVRSCKGRLCVLGLGLLEAGGASGCATSNMNKDYNARPKPLTLNPIKRQLAKSGLPAPPRAQLSKMMGT